MHFNDIELPIIDGRSTEKSFAHASHRIRNFKTPWRHEKADQFKRHFSILLNMGGGQSDKTQMEIVNWDGDIIKN